MSQAVANDTTNNDTTMISSMKIEEGDSNGNGNGKEEPVVEESVMMVTENPTDAQ